MPVGGADKDKEVAAETEDEDVTADIMDVTKSITQQILDSSVQDKPEVRLPIFAQSSCQRIVTWFATRGNLCLFAHACFWTAKSLKLKQMHAL